MKEKDAELEKLRTESAERLSLIEAQNELIAKLKDNQRELEILRSEHQRYLSMLGKRKRPQDEECRRLCLCHAG